MPEQLEGVGHNELLIEVGVAPVSKLRRQRPRLDPMVEPPLNAQSNRVA